MQKYNYSKKDLINGLLAAGVKPGDSIFIHSNLGFFGSLEGAHQPHDYYKIFKKSIFEVIGDSGTLITPSFSYSFCWGKIFDKGVTPGVCGFFSEMIRQDAQALRSEDANFSVSAIGKNAEYFTKDVSAYSFGESSFWSRFLEKNGMFCNFNFDAGSTFIHYVERVLKVSYRYDKPFSGVLISNGQQQQRAFYHFCYDLKKTDHAPEFSKFDKKAKGLGFAKVANVGRGQIVSISAVDTFDLIQKELKQDLAFLIKGNI